MTKKDLMLIIACVCVVLLMVWCSEESIGEPPLGAVSGHVYEAGTSNPIDSAGVFFRNSDDTTFTDESGFYVMVGWPATHTLKVQKAGYLLDSAQIDILSVDTITQDFELEKE